MKNYMVYNNASSESEVFGSISYIAEVLGILPRSYKGVAAYISKHDDLMLLEVKEPVRLRRG